jgi:hypothetical protein
LNKIPRSITALITGSFHKKAEYEMDIEYQVPRLGILRARLYSTAKKAYDILAQGGHIERMRVNPQLGVIRGVWEGAHHTRWEYVVTQLFLIDRLSNEGPQWTGLSNDTPRVGGERVSGADILQTWVLVLNAGHLLGTFASERGLLKVLIGDRELRRVFKSGLPRDQKILDFFDTVLVNEDIYRLHELLAYFYLYRLRRLRNTDIDLLKEVLKLYRFEPRQGAERRRKLRSLFVRVRQIAYLFLDSSYSPVPILFDLGSVLFDFQDYLEELFSYNGGALSKSLGSLERLLVDTLYLSAKSMYALGRHSDYVEAIISKGDSGKKSIRGLHSFLKEDDNFQLKTWPINPECLLRLWIDMRDRVQPATGAIEPLSLQSQWNNRLPNSRCKCIVASDPEKTVLGITVALSDNLGTNDKPRLFSEIVRLFLSLQDEFNSIRQRHQGFFSPECFMPSCKEMLLYILRQLWGEKVFFLPNPHTLYPDFWLMCRGATRASRDLFNICQDYERKGMHPDRLQEVKALAKALEHISHKGAVLMTTGQIIVRRRKDNTDITDIDGIAICADSKELSLLLVESKRTRRGSATAAKGRLKSTMDAIGIRPEDWPQIVTLRSYGAYARVFVFASAPVTCSVPDSVSG